MTQQTAYHFRPYEPSDAEAAVQVLNAASTTGLQRAVIDSVGKVRLTRYVPADAQKVVATNSQHEVVAYAYLANKEQHIVYEVGGVVHPHHLEKGIGQMLLDWAEQNAASLSTHAPTGVKTVLQTNLFEDEQQAIQLFTLNGYAKIREWLHLEIELHVPPELPPLPDGMVLREMDLENDWEIVGPAMDEAFADHWGAISSLPSEPSAGDGEGPDTDDEPEDESYSNAQGFCFIVLDNKVAAGGVLCNARLVERSDTARVGSLFVRPAYQRQGIGRTLMLAAFDAFWRHGIRRIITDTDAHSFSQTPRFYANLGMAPYRREFLYEKEIRPGKEVRKLNKLS